MQITYYKGLEIRKQIDPEKNIPYYTILNNYNNTTYHVHSHRKGYIYKIIDCYYVLKNGKFWLLRNYARTVRNGALQLLGNKVYSK